MTPRAIFGLAVRLLGLWFIYLTVQGLSTCFVSGYIFLHELIVAGAAVWCLFGAPPIQKWAYPEDSIAGPIAGLPPTSGASPFSHPTRPCVSCGKPIPLDAKLCPHCGWTQPG